MANHKHPGRKALERRQAAANARQNERDDRTEREQLELLYKRPGNSAREIARLT